MSRVSIAVRRRSASVPSDNRGQVLAESSQPAFADFAKEPGLYCQPMAWDAGILTHHWTILSRRKGILLGISLVGALAAFLFTETLIPLYQARTLLEIQNLNEDFLNKRTVTPTAPSSPFQSPEYNIRTQTVVLQSRPVLDRALDHGDMQNRLLAAESGERGFPWFGKQRPPGASSTSLRDVARSQGAAGLKVRVEPNTRIIEVTFDSSDPKVASDFVNGIASAFTDLSLEARWQSNQATSQWLSKHVEEVRAKLVSAEDSLQRYAAESNLIILSEKDDAAEQRLRQVQSELSKAQADRVAEQSVYELVSTSSPETLPEVLDDATLREYQVQLTALRRQLAELASSFTLEHPRMVNVKAQIATLEATMERKRSNIISRMRNEYDAAARREKLLSASYSAQAEFMSKQAGKVAHYSFLKREVDATRQLYDAMMQRVKEAGLASAMQANEIRVIEWATPPSAPYTPNTFLNTSLGLLAGICAWAALIIHRARSYRGILEPGQMAVELNIPELGVIPASAVDRSDARSFQCKSAFQLLPSQGEYRPELTTWQRWPSAIGESFRLTLTSILLSENNDDPLRVIAFTSANQGEGKTTVVSNLAIALARTDRRVLLIDGDMRKPRLHEIFEIDNSVGLSEALANTSRPEIRETKIPNLFLLPSGNSADEKLCFTARLRPLLEGLRADFDMILIDSPPLLQTSDARLLANCANAAVLVVAQHTDRNAVLLAQQRLDEDGSRSLGTILNNWDPKDSVHAYRNVECKNYYKSGERKAAAL